MPDAPQPPAEPAAAPKPDDLPRFLNSEQLLAGEREVFIRHGAETYRLRVTRQGKLILQK